MLLKRIEATPDALAYKYPGPKGEWADLSWRETEARVRAVAMGLVDIGMKPGDRCAIMARSSIDWILADFAVTCIGGTVVTVYPTSSASDLEFILKDSNVRFMFVEDDELRKRVLQIKEELPQLSKLIVFDGGPYHDPWLMRMEELEKLGQGVDAADPKRFLDLATAVQPNDLATIIYTSGTTGTPKGVELVQDSWVFEGETMAACGAIDRNELNFLWLPLAHSFAKVLQVGGVSIGYPTAVDGRVDRLLDNMAEVRPHFSAAAPRIFEKVYNRVVSSAQKSGIKRRLLSWAQNVGVQVSRLKQQGKAVPAGLQIKYQLADTLIFSKVRARFGGRMRFILSGGAPLSVDIAEFFHAAGILLMEGYGLTESSAASTCNIPASWRFGAVGKALPGAKIRIAEDGEVLIQSRGVMRGYHNQPALSQEMLTPDGWLRTGDIGHLDADGFLFITDRKKDLIKTSGGKYVAPQAIEMKLKLRCPYLSQVLVHGDRRNFCSALITLDADNAATWAKESGLGELSLAEISTHEAMQTLVREAVDGMNEELASYERIRKFAILPEDFEVEAGEVTPSLKVRRAPIEKKYQHILDGFYEGTVL